MPPYSATVPVTGPLAAAYAPSPSPSSSSSDGASGTSSAQASRSNSTPATSLASTPPPLEPSLQSVDSHNTFSAAGCNATEKACIPTQGTSTAEKRKRTPSTDEDTKRPLKKATGTANLVCPCGKGPFSATTLKRHQQKSIKCCVIAKQRISCPFCGALFSPRSDGLLRHIDQACKSLDAPRNEHLRAKGKQASPSSSERKHASGPSGEEQSASTRASTVPANTPLFSTSVFPLSYNQFWQQPFPPLMSGTRLPKWPATPLGSHSALAPVLPSSTQPSLRGSGPSRDSGIAPLSKYYREETRYYPRGPDAGHNATAQTTVTPAPAPQVQQATDADHAADEELSSESLLEDFMLKYCNDEF